jgi:phage gp36-like protein
MPGDINSKRERSFDTSNFAQPLAEAEVDGYLTWQFRVAARRPKALTLRETAAVARYLLCLALHGVPKEIVDGGPDAVRKHWRDHLLKGERMREANDARQCVQRTAEIVWGDLLQFGQFEVGSKREAQSFFKKHSSYWYHHWLEPALKFLEEFEVPPWTEAPFHQQQLVGPHVSEQGGGNPYLENDLSQRIAAADYALKKASIRGRRARIAKALNESPMCSRPNDSWGPEEVRNRVRSYERMREHRSSESLVDESVFCYRQARYLEEHRSRSKSDQSSVSPT